MNRIRHYINFNASSGAHILKAKHEKCFSAAICNYNSTNISSFFLREDTMTYVLGGEKYMFVNNQEFYLSEGDLLYIPKNTVIFTHIATTTHNFESLNILLKAQQDILGNNTRLFKGAIALKNEVDSFLNTGFSAVTQTSENEALRQLLSFLENLTLSETTRRLIYPEENFVISDVVIDSIFEPMTLDLLAAESYMSVSTFKRKFKKYFEEPPQRWIRGVRLQAAYFYLRMQLYKVSDVASFVGFENLAHFTYAFKKNFNQLPSSVAKGK